MRECVNALREGRHECCNHPVYTSRRELLLEDRAKLKSFTSSFNAV
jgi:hypothetical protein